MSCHLLSEIFLYLGGHLCYNHYVLVSEYALLAQWIEYQPPTLMIWVRIPYSALVIIMTIREEIEKKEHETLSPYASMSDSSKGRMMYEEPCDIRTCYDRDRDRILHSKIFRRLKHKTQVFMEPVGDHYRTRMTHTLEVAQIGRTIGKALSLNEGLVEAIALGHDLGHTPFGHVGERALDRICPYGFSHNEQSLRVVDIIENNGKGLNLTYEVRDGILNHKTGTVPSTLEGKVVRLADKIAYLHHDMDDAIRSNLVSEDDVPLYLQKILGSTTKQRLDLLVHDVINSSYKTGDVIMSKDIFDAMYEFRRFMFEKVYKNEATIAEDGKAEGLLIKLYEYFIDNPQDLTQLYRELIDRGEPKEKVVCDYISGMTDSYATMIFKRLYVPGVWEKE